MTQISWSECLLGAGAIVLASGWLYMASGIQESLLSDAVGAAGVPKVLGWIVLGLGILLCLRGLKPMLSHSDKHAGAPAARPHLMAAGLLAILACYVLLVPYLGYAPAIALLVAAVARYGGAPAGRNMLLIAVAAGAGFWLVFVQLLGIPMPVSIFLEGR